jgi:hypothetical protein
MKNKLATLLSIFGCMVLSGTGPAPAKLEFFENEKPSEYDKLLQEAKIEELVAQYIDNLIAPDAREILEFMRKEKKENFVTVIPVSYDEDADQLIDSLSWMNNEIKDKENVMEDLLIIRETYKTIKTLPTYKQVETYIQAEVCTAAWTRSYPSKTNIINLLKKCILASYTKVNG